jgi:hypothetical protein
MLYRMRLYDILFSKERISLWIGAEKRLGHYFISAVVYVSLVQHRVRGEGEVVVQ